jgi:hypothetical protein
LENFFKKSIICQETNECLNFGINKRLDFLNNNTSQIKNVEDMRIQLEKRVLDKENFKNNLESYFTQNSDKYTCIGTLNIYELNTHKMEFMPECLHS